MGGQIEIQGSSVEVVDIGLVNVDPDVLVVKVEDGVLETIVVLCTELTLLLTLFEYINSI